MTVGAVVATVFAAAGIFTPNPPRPGIVSAGAAVVAIVVPVVGATVVIAGTVALVGEVVAPPELA